MHIHDATWTGPTCSFCCAPVKDLRMHCDHQELWNKLKEENPNAPKPPYFCSTECVYAKYIG